MRENGRVVLKTDPTAHDVPPAETGTPTYAGLPLDRYVSLFEMLNPMHRLWSDGRWNKLTLAHGCYWKKCTFCDVSLDYIGHYEAASADLLVDRIVALVAETGETGFHFVDEAAPPAMLRALSQRLLDRGVHITWWGNIRFEKTFTPALCALMARAGCIAVTGGLEVASDRLLALMQKGVTVEQVARVTRAFTDADVMVHAYLMYGFPTETEQETIDALERVRQLFDAGCIQSAFWHRFAATVHSPIGMGPRCTGSASSARRRPSPATSCPSSTRPAPTTTSWARGCARRSTTTCTGWGWTSTSVPGFLRPNAERGGRGARSRPRRSPPISSPRRSPPDHADQTLVSDLHLRCAAGGARRGGAHARAAR